MGQRKLRFASPSNKSNARHSSSALGFDCSGTEKMSGSSLFSKKMNHKTKEALYRRMDRVTICEKPQDKKEYDEWRCNVLALVSWIYEHVPETAETDIGLWIAVQFRVEEFIRGGLSLARNSSGKPLNLHKLPTCLMTLDSLHLYKLTTCVMTLDDLLVCHKFLKASITRACDPSNIQHPFPLRCAVKGDPLTKLQPSLEPNHARRGSTRIISGGDHAMGG